MSSKYKGLREIAGIGLVTEARLKKHCRVETLSDLASSSAAEIVSCLQMAGASVTLETAETWIAEADLLIGDASVTAGNAIEAKSAPQNDEDAANMPQVADETVLPSIAEDGWRYLGAFILAFRMREVIDQRLERSLYTYPLSVTPEGDWLSEPSKEDSFADEDIDKVFQWQLNLLGVDWPVASGDLEEAAAQGSEKPNTEEEPVSYAEITERPAPFGNQPVKLKIVQLKIYQPPTSIRPIEVDRTTEKITETLQGGQPFDLELALTSEPQQEIVEGVTCIGHFELWSSETGIRSYLGRTDPIEIAYSDRMTVLRLTNEKELDSGSYDLSALVMVNSSPPTMALAEIQKLQFE